jgi:hypothetical protein
VSPISDRELAAHLERRSADRLTVVQRQTMLSDVARAKGGERRWTFRPAMLVAPIAAALILAVLLYPLFLTIGWPPVASPSGPGASATTSPSALPGSPPAATPSVYSAQQLSDMIGDPDWIGQIVLAQVRIGHMMAPPVNACSVPLGPCTVAFLADVTGKSVVDVGWRDAANGQGHRVDDGAAVRWVQLVAVHEELGLKAFKIQAESVQYLGPVVAHGNDPIWLVAQVPVGAPDEASDDLYAVDGWLLETIIASCPAPNDYGPGTSLEYWCGGSFLIGSNASAPQVSDVFDLGGLHVQGGAYQEFAPDPSLNRGEGTEPRRATYLVRQAACQPVVAGECPVWRMVGRLD